MNTLRFTVLIPLATLLLNSKVAAQATPTPTPTPSPTPFVEDLPTPTPTPSPSPSPSPTGTPLTTPTPTPSPTPVPSSPLAPGAPVTAIYLPGATAQSGDEFNPVGVITIPAASAVIPITTSDIDPGVNDTLRGFQGDFTYDSSVVTFSETPITAGTLTADWTVMFNSNLTCTTGMKIMRISGFGSTALDTTEGNHVLVKMTVIRKSNTADATAAATWGTSTTTAPLRFDFVNESSVKIPPIHKDPGAFIIAAPP